jgi:hypothetical protein
MVAIAARDALDAAPRGGLDVCLDIIFDIVFDMGSSCRRLAVSPFGRRG